MKLNQMFVLSVVDEDDKPTDPSTLTGGNGPGPVDMPTWGDDDGARFPPKP